MRTENSGRYHDKSLTHGSATPGNITVLLGLVLTLLGGPLGAAEEDSELKYVEEVPFDIPYTKEGADECLRCHDETSDFPVMDIFHTPHADLADPSAPFSQQQCESCHGPGSEHAGRVRRREQRPAILGFEDHSSGTREQRNGVCLDCHESGSHDFAAWDSSAHNYEELACTDCHQIHVANDPVQSAATQPEVCFTCHSSQRADSMKFSSHPLRAGEMACSDCHTPHQSLNESSLTKFTTTELCYTCHAEKRGPFLWEHAPATEDCGTCHEPHGSGHPDLLTRRPPLLCQSCHSRQDHPSLSLSAENFFTDARQGEIFMLGSSCTNCHSQVHGSNHPSGASLNR